MKIPPETPRTSKEITMWSSNSNSQDSQNGKIYGMTSAISVAPPKPIDISLTQELEDVLKKFDVTESDEEFNHRMEVLSRLNELVKEWILEMSLSRNMPREIAEQVGGKIYTFGSYRLGVHSRGADIDALCVAPRHIERSDYFKSFYEKLKTCSDVKELRAVEEAFVPVLKMNFSGIEIDLLFARLALREIPENVDLNDDMILKNLDQRCVRSLNGCRVTDEILRLVPNVDTFRAALRAIKLWAKQHGIYSNVLGYLGGVSWAMLVARTCQLYPTAVAGTIVHKFFQVFAQWPWPQPVLLKQTTAPNLDFPVWDPRVNVADRAHLMPIITPAFPQQNSTYNVSQSTRTIICKGINKGFRICEAVMMGRAKWPLLFEKPDFFSEYKHFILLVASSGSQEEHLEWYGLVEAKVRHLVTILERNRFIQLVHANPEIFKLREDYFKNEADSQECYEERPNSVWAVGLEFHKISAASINLTIEIQNFTNAVMKHALGIKMYKESMKIEAKYVKVRNLNQYLSEEVLKRDRPSSIIMAAIPENGATILLRKRNLDETSPVGAVTSPGAATKNNIRKHINQFRKVNNLVESNNRPKQSTTPPASTSPNQPVKMLKLSPESGSVTSTVRVPTASDENEIIDLSASDDTDAVLIDDEDSDPSPVKKRKLSSGSWSNLTITGRVPTPDDNEIIDLSESDDTDAVVIDEEIDLLE